jgi:dolichol-phosphate mannosyltransferase
MQLECKNICGYNYEIIFVNDGSSDGTLNIIKDLCIKDNNVVGIDLIRNHGHQLALTAGLKITQGRRVLIIDADLQDPPELLPVFMKMMDYGYDVVYGQRVARSGETWFKVFSASLFYQILKIIGQTPIPVDTGDFRLINQQVVKILNNMPESDRFIRGMVAWVGGKQAPLCYERSPRFAGKTKYSLRKMVRFALDGITGFSIAPLRIATLMAFLGIFLAVLLGIYVMFGFFSGAAIPGWTSLGVIILFFSSAQLFSLGIIGEYLGRAFLESKNRPLILVREIFGKRYQENTDNDSPCL